MSAAEKKADEDIILREPEKRLRKLTSEKADRLWTIDDVVDYLGIPERTIKLYVATGKIPSVKIGRHRRFDPSEIKKWVSRK